MADTIKRFSKSKGYESLPRELLQSKELTLEAIGLIANISSYPENWVLRKTELQKRFPKHGRRVIDRIWDELVENSYILQFRKRVGRSYDYRYFYDVTPFSAEEVQELLHHNFDDNFMLYHKDMKSEGFNVKDLTDYVFIENKGELDCSFWDVQNAQSTECDNTNVSSSVHFEQFNLDSPKRTLSKLTKEKINYKDNNNNNNYINSDENETELDILNELSKDQGSVGHATRFLYSTGLDIKLVVEIAMALYSRPYLAIPELIVQQIELTNNLVKAGKMYSYAAYFIRGLEMRYQGYESSVDTGDINNYYSSVSGRDVEAVGQSLIDLITSQLANGG